MFHFSEIQQFLNCLETFPGNFCNICPRFEIYMESAQYDTVLLVQLKIHLPIAGL